MSEAVAKKLKSINENSPKDVFYALLIDIAVWFYLGVVSHKIIYNKLIAGIRYPDFYWSEPLMAFIIGTFIALVLFNIKGFSLGKRIKGVHQGQFGVPFYKHPYLLIGFLLLLFTFIAGIEQAQVSLREFFSASGLTGAKRIFTALLTPNFEIFEEALFAAIETIYMAFIATIFSIPVAFLVSFAAARNLMNSSPFLLTVYNVVRFFLNITRSIEPLVWAIIFSVWVGIGPFAGMLALFLHSIASLSKLYSEQIESIDNGPIEAMTATGAHPIQIIWYGVVPQIVLPFLSFTIYRWDINVRMATVIGLVGGGGIGTMLMQYQGQAKWHEVGLLVFVIAFIVWVMDFSSAKIREAIK